MEAEESQENPGFQSCAAVTRLLAVQHCTGKCMWWYVMMYGVWKINHAQVYRMNELIKNINFGDLKNENDYKCAHMNFIGHGASSTGRSCLKKRTGHQCHLFLLRVNATLFVGSSRKCWMSVKRTKIWDCLLPPWNSFFVSLCWCQLQNTSNSQGRRKMSVSIPLPSLRTLPPPHSLNQWQMSR